MIVNLRPQEGSKTGGMQIVITDHRAASKGVPKVVGYTKKHTGAPITFIRQNGLLAAEVGKVVEEVKKLQVAEEDE